MHTLAALAISMVNLPTVVQQNGTVQERPWSTYGYIAVGALILVIIVVVLVRKQHRKFNE